MSTRVITCVTIACDGCGHQDEELDWDGPAHFSDRAAAASWMTSWEIPTTAVGPDLCPDCLCERDGHDLTPLDEDGCTYCERCRTFEQQVLS